MPTRRTLVLSGVLTTIIAAMLPLKVVADSDGLLDVALSTAAAQEGNGGNGDNGGGNGNGGGGGNGSESSGGSGNGNGSDNGGGSGNNGNGTGSGNSGGNGSAAGSDTETGAAGGPGKGPGAGQAPGGGTANPGSAPGPAAAPARPATPAPPAKAGAEVDVRGTSITVRHHNGATERISQGRYEMRDSRSRTIVNRTATPSDASRLQSFGR